MYLSASDGSVAWQESEFIRDYLGWNLSTNEIHQFIKENQIYSTEFESEVPASMRLFVRADNAVYENEGRNESLACEILFRIYEALGKEFLACVNDVTDNEVERFNHIFKNITKLYSGMRLKVSKTIVI